MASADPDTRGRAVASIGDERVVDERSRPSAPVGVCLNVRADTDLTGDLDPLARHVARFAATEFTHLELGANGLGVVIGHRAHPARLEMLRDALSGCRQRLTLHSSWSGSGRIGDLLDHRSRAGGFDGLIADLDVAAAIGAEVLVYHAGVLAPADDDSATDAPDHAPAGAVATAAMQAERDGLRRLGERAAELGVRVAVENRTPSPRTVAARSYGLRPDLVAEQVLAVDHPAVTMCLDTGHAFLAATHLGFDFLDTVRAVAPYVGHMHLADNFGRLPGDPDSDLREREFLGEGDLHLPPGWGSIPLRELLTSPYPQDPIVILEMRHLRHHAEALSTYRALRSAPDQP